MTQGKTCADVTTKLFFSRTYQTIITIIFIVYIIDFLFLLSPISTEHYNHFSIECYFHLLHHICFKVYV